MKIRVFISALSLLFGITSVYGQVNLSEMVPASTDSLQKSRIRYKVWDFSQKLGSKGAEQVMFMKDSTGVVSVIEPGKIRYYRTTPTRSFSSAASRFWRSASMSWRESP